MYKECTTCNSTCCSSHLACPLPPLLAENSMNDYLDALQQCSLINLEDSPQLLRQSLLQRGAAHTLLLWDSTEVSIRASVALAAAVIRSMPLHNSWGPTCHAQATEPIYNRKQQQSIVISCCTLQPSAAKASVLDDFCGDVHSHASVLLARLPAGSTCWFTAAAAGVQPSCRN
jgi:hypothetical protein